MGKTDFRFKAPPVCTQVYQLGRIILTIRYRNNNTCTKHSSFLKLPEFFWSQYRRTEEV